MTAYRDMFDQMIADADEKQALEQEILRLRGDIATLEKLRPHWAQGYSDDSMAAQAATGALSEIYDLLGVKDQTAAVAALKTLLKAKRFLMSKRKA